MNTYNGASLSIIGSSHIKANAECQDSSSYDCTNEFSVAVVCDGHGSDKHFRSAIGSRMAAYAAIHSLSELMKYEQSFPDNKHDMLVQIEKNIILNWNNAVNDHLLGNPFTEEELSKLSDKDRNSINRNVEAAYGSTLIAAVLTDRFCFGIQIGDGDCLVIDEHWGIFNPVQVDDRLQFNITTSLCDKNAIQNFRHFWIDKPLVALLLSTDGVRNSFTSAAYFHSFCLTVIESFHEMSNHEAVEELSEFLQKLTANGSGDDVSITTIFNVNYLSHTLQNNIEAADESNLEDVVDGLSANDTEGITE